MGLFTGKSVYARDRDGQDCTPDPSQAQPSAKTKYIGLCTSLIWLICTAFPVASETIRIATFNVSLGRKGPGLLLRDLGRGDDPQIATVMSIISKVRPDILLLTDFDHDYDGIALGVFRRKLAAQDIDFMYSYAVMSNAGRHSGADLNGDGYFGGPEDRHGFGRFPGAGSMAILSAFPVNQAEVRDFSSLLWQDLPEAKNAGAHPAQRLAYRSAWDVPVVLPDGRILHLLASHASPPVFDGPDDLNGRRNADEIRFWSLFLDGALPGIDRLRPEEPFVLLGDFNADPWDGEGARADVRALLGDVRITDPQPSSRGGSVAATAQGGPNLLQLGDPALDTVDWDETRTPGNMRVDYVLPSSDLVVTGAGVFWPAPDEDGFDLVGSDGQTGSHHRLVWVDIAGQ
jgi:hypothetical protein